MAEVRDALAIIRDVLLIVVLAFMIYLFVSIGLKLAEASEPLKKANPECIVPDLSDPTRCQVYA